MATKKKTIKTKKKSTKKAASKPAAVGTEETTTESPKEPTQTEIPGSEPPKLDDVDPVVSADSVEPRTENADKADGADDANPKAKEAGEKAVPPSDTPPKRKRGRPKGSKNKKKTIRAKRTTRAHKPFYDPHTGEPTATPPPGTAETPKVAVDADVVAVAAVEAIDKLSVALAGYFVGGELGQLMAAAPEEKAEISKAAAAYMKAHDVQMTPGAYLGFVVAMTYGNKATVLYRENKARKNGGQVYQVTDMGPPPLESVKTEGEPEPEKKEA